MPSKTAKPNAEMDRSFLEASVPELIAKLTLDEKAQLLAGRDFWHTVPIPRLNIPSVKVTDGPNGARGGSFYKMTPASALPNATAIGAAFDTALVTQAGTLLAAEAKARNAVCLLAPTINIQRSPLGGRAFESFSEDPTLSGHIAAAYVNALQAQGISPAIKHFVGNDQEHERMGADSVISQRALREVYLRPFQIAQRLAAPWAYMTAYNKVNGTHVSENKALLTKLLREEWGHSGLVMSDWFGTYGTDTSINAGLDLEMPGPARWRTPELVGHLINAHKIDRRAVDARAASLLNWVQKLARANPDIVYAPPGPERTRTEHQAEDAKLIRKLGTDGIVLLKNNGVLPVRQGKVAIIGPNAKARVITGGGSAQLKAAWSVSPWEGLVANKPDAVDLSYELGCQGAKFLPLLDEHFTHPQTDKQGYRLKHYAIKDGVQAAEAAVDELGEQSDLFMVDFYHPDLDNTLLVTEIEAVLTAPITGAYKFGITVTGQGWLYVDGKLVIDNSRKQVMGSAFFGNGTEEQFCSIPVEKGKQYTVLFKHDSRQPDDRSLTDTTPFICTGMRLGAFADITPEQAIADAVAAAKDADSVILVAGLNADWESEGYDRPDLSLPYRSDELIAAVAAANPNTAVVVQAGSAVAMPWVESVAAVVYAWYGGNECGNAIADIVYGAVNPSGRLPITLPRRAEDIAAHTDFKSARKRVHYHEDVWVGYKHFEKRAVTPLFPFGHGLSYTTFDYADLTVGEPTGSTAADWAVTASVKVTNTGKVAGAHSVHFYTSPPPPTSTSLEHPAHALQAFAKVVLQPGQTETVEVKLDKYAISHWDELDETFRAEQGEWHVSVGKDASTFYGKATFVVDKELDWRGL
ncbi:hypothetical protein Q5752_003304 [Cryptotrichosporon argae]